TLSVGSDAGGPFKFLVTAGKLPAGITLSTSGLLSGTSTTAGTFPFAVTATGAGGLNVTQAYSLTVDPAAASYFVVVRPPSVTHGTPFGITGEAVDAFGTLATGYRGTVKFGSSQTVAGLPATYTFTAADNGVHTFGGLTLYQSYSLAAIFVSDANDS